MNQFEPTPNQQAEINKKLQNHVPGTLLFNSASDKLASNINPLPLRKEDNEIQNLIESIELDMKKKGIDTFKIFNHAQSSSKNLSLLNDKTFITYSTSFISAIFQHIRNRLNESDVPVDEKQQQLKLLQTSEKAINAILENIRINKQNALDIPDFYIIMIGYLKGMIEKNYENDTR